MDDESDLRPLCKYGRDCYQKNSEHQKKYKHLFKRISPPKKTSSSPKRFKIEDGNYSKVENGSQAEIITSDLPVDIKERIKILFLVDMPDDFYELYEFCKSLSNESPKKALISMNLELVGPFDVFNEIIKDCTQAEALRHYRYYYDPPEFQTILKVNDKDQLHYGYFRDDPKELPCFVAKSKTLVGPAITCIAGNIFGAVNVHAEEVKSSADIFRKMKIQKLQTALLKWAKTKKISLDTVTPEIKARRSKVVAKTFNGVGVVVPYDKKTDIGYRPLAVSEQELNKILKSISSADSESEREVAWSKLQPVITAASIANDECDFGTSLELGLDMFAFGEEILHTSVKQVMCTTYKLLQRTEFAQVLEAHLNHRSRDCNLSTIC